MKYHSKTYIEEFTFDNSSVVNAYLKLRNLYPHACLLEATDYLPNENCFSYIAVNPVASFKLNKDRCFLDYPDKSKQTTQLDNKQDALDYLESFFSSFAVDTKEEFEFIANGAFGYLSYDAIEHFEQIELQPSKDSIPEIYYQVYEYVIAINHYRNKAFILKNSFDEATESGVSPEDLIKLINTPSPCALGQFKRQGELSSNMTEAEHGEMIENCKKHIQRGDVFQIVPSRSFTQEYQGDDFQVYRALRSINPSPYLFYYDFGSFRIFGSSPEAELLIKGDTAQLHPIAGTCPNVDDQEKQESLITKLLDDPKENAEHVMLVDLARNDLNKHCLNVKVERYREVQKFSHVIHLVSVVSGQVTEGNSAFQLLADTFPAGTLSGAPKYRAMELIDKYEPDRREFYGGALGFVHFNGDCLHAIMIRTFLSRNGKLIRRAGGGVVSESTIPNEVAEVQNKLMALEKAIIMAEEIV